MAPITTHTCKLTPDQAKTLHRLLRAKTWEFREVPYARFAASSDKVNVVFYESGKLVVQGKETQEFIEFVLEPEVLKAARLGYEEILDPTLLQARIGVDESGKGDFFGPMCVAGVYVNEAVIRAWKGVGIRDSKTVGSDRKIGELARTICETPGCVTTVVPIGNEAYNRLHHNMRSVNAVLAWGHARVIENLLGQRHRMEPWPERAVSDQFAATKDVVAKALMREGRQIELVQRHRAEADLAVAAASILARNEFVTRLARLSSEYGVELPKGASKEVEEAGRALVTKHGEEALSKVGKMHFRTSFRIRGLPEPKKVEWKGRRQETSQGRDSFRENR